MSIIVIEVAPGIEVPVEADSPEEAEKKADAWYSSGEINADNAVRGVARGVPAIGTFSDEANAGIDAALSYPGNWLNEQLGREWRDPAMQETEGKSFNERYSGLLERERNKDEAFDRRNPKASMGLKFGGGVLGMLALAKSDPALFEQMYGGLGLSEQALRSAISTGLLSGASAFGEGEGGAGERATGSIMPAIMGAGVGAAIPFASKLAQKGIDKFGKMTGLFGATDDPIEMQAGKYLDDTLRRDGQYGPFPKDQSLAEVGGTSLDATTKAVSGTYPSKGGQVMHDAAKSGQLGQKGEAVLHETAKAAEHSARQGLGLEHAANPPPGVTESLFNATSLFGRGLGTWGKETAQAIGRKMANGNVDELTLKVAQMLVKSAPDALDEISRLAAAEAKTAAQKAAIDQIIRAVAAGGSPTVTGGRF